ncbi:hypothetical protein QN395_08145 [Undibacterium sp. RTI2.2]|uniref:hypothetical protein n=1 Tax=unclassified Undibacterium TaxID=2630295 RepID=UPI002AB49BA9|nr:MULTISPECIES: hypothetical protein [unclassified Undibacterium]MDY7539944.1 hypothetical protein [Undibacterium sp. 5I1]MEB0116455.1 hypothetical protein [Undibacterium sp. RTI2.2]MEB0230551.1 hypothetical protein [Undibacterium sp. 10I3]MEB0257249.1 hypothetical protein [Undibacterium sp. 5I1]
MKNLNIGAITALALVIILGGCSDQKSEKTVTASQASVPQPSMPSVQILKWGPQSTVAGTTFSAQPNGNSAIWFEQRGIGNAGMVEVWFADKKLEGMAITPDSGGSAEVPAELLKTPGKFPVYLILKPEGKRVEIGIFEVTAS